ncbi:MAG: S8 family peptidase, partial [Anaerovoracaceae bacterium]
HGTHGTMVLSIAGAVKSNNGIGMAGVASGATFQPYLAGYSCSDEGYGMSAANFVKVYEHALANGVNIMNMSFGGPDYEPAENTVIQRATQKGLISVGSRGNDGRKSNPTIANYPACYSGVIMAGALTQSNTLADFSSYNDCGNKNLVTAYGAKVITATFDGYWTVNGTSFSAPITAGVLAVMKSANPTATSTELKNALLSTATDLGASGYDQKYGYGGINPLAAVNKANPYIRKVGLEIFYLKKDGSNQIILKENYNTSGVKIGITFYQTGTRYGAHTKKESYKYNLNSNNTKVIINRENYNNSGVIIGVTFYQTGVKYGNHTNKESYRYNLKSDNTKTIVNKESYNNSGIVTGVTFYQIGVKYGNHTKKESYKYNLKGDNSKLIVNKESYNTSGVKIGVTFYQTGVKYGNHTNKESYKYNLNSDNSNKIINREEYNANGKIIGIMFFQVGVKYGSHANKESHKYFLKSDGSQEIVFMEQYDATGKKISVTYYKAGTKYGKQANNAIYKKVLVNGVWKVTYL